MGLSKKAIETISVNAVRDSIVMSEYLDQFIPDNDKEPFWDGAVYIYKSDDHKKENFQGRVPVQVKGQECSDLSLDEISFPVRTTDLRGYLADGGAVYFVVYIGNRGLIKKIYYVELTPVRIQILLEEAKTQKSKTVKLKEFPSESDKKATIFMNFFQNAQKQASFANAKLYSLEELQKQVQVEKITIPISGIGIENDLQMALINNDVYVYAHIKGSTIPQPIRALPIDKHTQEETDAVISINGKLYYNKIRVIKSAEYIKCVFGESFSITALLGKDGVKIDYKNSDDVRVLATDLAFLLAYYENGYFDFNGDRCPFDYKSASMSNFDLEAQRGMLEFAQKATTVLDALSCTKKLSIRDLGDEDCRNIDRLYTALIEKRPVSGLRENLPRVCLMSVGNLNFAVALQKQNDKKTYILENFFETDVFVYYADKNERLPVSQYYLLTSKDLLKIDNMQWVALLPSFQKIEKHKETFSYANAFLLRLLSAYDQSCNKEILRAAHSFAEWICTAPEEELAYEIRMLNLLQTVKRMRDLNQEEIRMLYRIISNKETPDLILVGAYLLLGEQVPAEMYFANMSVEDQKEFTQYPIYHFWKNEPC